ncbi:hypothetical protein D0860_00155 [Hortaea werneckii]|uniref:Cupin 2 conserved barrel domain-containing protein n=1 Tax=Hortaea werneckii TaxID=91943 RepID=A0A3M7HX73_HORWE|nr:hypothetical protein D0860_00155 [Hortaea werneckii]RMZ34756.1 hypothetical protein D0859_01056 [Hortaea werneckii]
MPDPTAPVTVTKCSSLQTSRTQTSGMLRQNALTDLTPHLCASRMIAQPHTASAIHHHEDQDTVVFAFSGSGGTIEVNEGEEEVVWCIVRSGMSPKVRNLEGWS